MVKALPHIAKADNDIVLVEYDILSKKVSDRFPRNIGRHGRTRNSQHSISSLRKIVLLGQTVKPKQTY